MGKNVRMGRSSHTTRDLPPRSQPTGPRREHATQSLGAAGAPRVQATIGWAEALLIASLVLLSVALLAGGAYLWLNGVPPTDRSGTLLGTVVLRNQGTSHAATQAQTVDYVADGGRATVVVTTADDGTQVATARVDAQGRFSLRLPPGSYMLRVQAPGDSLKASASPLVLYGGEVLTPTLQATAAVRAASTTP